MRSLRSPVIQLRKKAPPEPTPSQRLAQAKAAYEASIQRLADYEGMLRYAERRHAELAADLALAEYRAGGRS